MPFFDHDDVQFHYREAGRGLPFVFQHGLGGDINQPFGLYRPDPGRADCSHSTCEATARPVRWAISTS